MLPSVVVDRALITFEQSGTTNNLQALLDGMAGGGETAAGEPAESSSDTASSAGEFRLNGAGCVVAVGESLTLTLPDQIVLRDLSAAKSARA